uniref:ATP synthase subunit a n=1 Tax=Zorotypus medoensis TaxID=1264643 RepID=A0A0A7C388_9NEOP|nr:ATP synthase F0 subunit 6 [Zorotypus medoensis]AFY30506.1 ATP synthase F0 subunit 6 [Zorotypus medoensis]AHY35144.1 ATP synthase F0 subunit 6 [Zorotypus medoensis]
MMTNLFSIFDPTSSTIINMNWMTFTIMMLILPNSKWTLFNKQVFMNNLMSILKINFPISHNDSFLNKNIIPGLFISITIMNIMGLIPYIFSVTSHFSITLSIALPLWMGFMSLGYTKNFYKMLSHTIPANTPYLLIPFMILIETTSNFIRPITLSVRLMANITAGHLLMTLISSIQSSLSMVILIIFMQSVFMILESAVSIIQAYVFSLLISLYWQETN